MLQSILNMDTGDDIEMVVSPEQMDDNDVNATNIALDSEKNDDEDALNDGIMIDESKPKRRRGPIVALSTGLLIGTLISTTILIAANVRSGSMVPSIFTSVIQEQRYCRRYPRPPAFAGKKGVGIVMNDDITADTSRSSTRNLPILQSLRPYWNYGWSVVRSTMQPDDIEWVPMVWGGKNSVTVKERIDLYVVPHIRTGVVKRILGFNEPDAATQSNMSVNQAIEIWPSLQSTNTSVISPSCAQPANEWMKSFMIQATETCKRIDWVAVHWYGSADFITFRNTIRNYYYMYGKRPIIITEFAVANFRSTSFEGNGNTPAEVLNFMKRAIPWLESRLWVVGYAWFSFQIDDVKGWPSALFDDAGQLTPLGQFYASVRKETPYGNRTIQ